MARFELRSQFVKYPWLRSGGYWLCRPYRRAFFHRLPSCTSRRVHLQSDNVVFELGKLKGAR